MLNIGPRNRRQPARTTISCPTTLTWKPLWNILATGGGISDARERNKKKKTSMRETKKQKKRKSIRFVGDLFLLTKYIRRDQMPDDLCLCVCAVCRPDIAPLTIFEFHSALARQSFHEWKLCRRRRRCSTRPNCVCVCGCGCGCVGVCSH